MSELPSPSKVSGNHRSLYEAYYNMVDPNSHGQIAAMDAAKFLKKSHLSDVILSKIWDISDPSSRGFLNKPGMFVALKLCALAQQGYNLNISNIYMDIPPPKMGESLNTENTSCCSQFSTTSITHDCWTITSIERAKYEQLFQSLDPVNGYIPGNKVKGVLMDSKLPLETLGKIWDLSDIDKDGKLNEHEFVLAMHLVYKALESNTVPNVLPPELIDNCKSTTKDTNLKPQVSATPISGSLDATSMCKNIGNFEEWVVSNDDLKASDKLFVQADEDMDGFVSGTEIKDIFIQSGLSQSVLANIWNLCDISQNGKLNKEQFALSMWLIKQKLSGFDLPIKLSLEMVPPSLRKKSSDCIIENNNVSSYSNPELDMVSKDIIQINRDKHTLEQDISQKEADIRIKSGEIKSLQSELDTLAATLRQLDNQKGEAQKRLNDLKAQVDKLRQQAMDQESTLHSQEEELVNKRQEIECLKLAEQNLELQQNEYKERLIRLNEHLQKIQLEISQTKAGMTQFEEKQRQIIDIIIQFDSALAVQDANNLPDASLFCKFQIEEITFNLDGSNDTKDMNMNGSDRKKDLLNNNKEFHVENRSEPSKDGEKQFQYDSEPFTADFEEAQNNVKDPFGEDPFAALHAPARCDSPSPALPPKKSKQPPPRPAPPRPTQGPQGLLGTSLSTNVTSGAHSDPFSDNITSLSNSCNTYEFADFTNFDPKQ